MDLAHLSKEELVERIETLEEQLRLLLHKKHGRKSEQVSADQLSLLVSDETPSVDSDEITETIDVSYTRKRGKRKPLDSNLERKSIHYHLPEDQQQCDCGVQLKDIGTITAEHYEYIPARVLVVEHIQHKYVCPCCEGKLVLAEKPKSILPKTNAGPHLLAHISTTKFVDGVPLHRQESQLQRLGIDLSRNTMARWLIQLAQVILPLINLLEDAIRAGPFIQCDETPFQVLNELGRKASQLSYMWVRRGGVEGQMVVLYHYNSSRSSAVVKQLFADYKGIVQCDGYSAYGCLASTDITLVGCMSHARRKFNDALKASGKKQATQKTKAAMALKYFKQLYKIEEKLKGCDDLTRYQVRQQEAKPILEELKAWLDLQANSVLPKSTLGRAVSYTRNQWDRLIRYCDYGVVEIDNNADERAIRPFAIGRRNWLFSASENGAHTNARFYSLIETCKLHGHEPYAYLSHIFKELPLAEKLEDYEALLPWNLDVARLKELSREV